jgi:hypothetical protein
MTTCFVGERLSVVAPMWMSSQSGRHWSPTCRPTQTSLKKGDLQYGSSMW